MNRLFYKLILGLIFFVLGVTVWLLYPAQGVPVLAYHMVNDRDELYSIKTAEFEQQMQFLAEHGYTPVSLKEYFAAVKQQQPLPPKPVVITFDDGYEDNLTIALPIMEKYGMKGTVFMIAGNVGKPGYLTWQQLTELCYHHTEIGSHTFSHVNLRELNEQELRKEMAGSKQLLEGQLGVPIEFLAYPYGGVNQNVLKVVQETGYLGACSGKPGLNTKHTNDYLLKRISIPQPRYGLWEFRLRLLRAEVYEKLGKQ